jgi:hypothetical protein
MKLDIEPAKTAPRPPLGAGCAAIEPTLAPRRLFAGLPSHTQYRRGHAGTGAATQGDGSAP